MDFAYLIEGAIAFLFVDHKSSSYEKLRAKERLWDNALRGNVLSSMSESSQILEIDSGLRHIDWVTTEALAKGLTDLLETLWSDTHTLISDFLYLMIPDARERQSRVEWMAEYEMIPMHFLLHLTLDLNTWCIHVDKKAVEIDLPSMYDLRFRPERRMLDQPQMPPPEALHPDMPAPHPFPNQAPSAATA